MEKKIVIVPFDVELAKRIQNGDVEGKIITDDGRIVRIVCFDMKSDDCIVALVQGEFEESVYTYTPDGRVFVNKSPLDLMLKIPEYMTFKDGDVIYAESIFGSDFIFVKKEDSHKTSKHVSLMNGIDLSFDNRHCCEDYNIKILRKATDDEKQTMINALRVSKHECAKEYLKRFFNIEVKSKCDFKVGQPVIGIDGRGEWRYDLFSHYKPEYRNGNYVCSARSYSTCLPYNDQTAHLLGTTEDYKGD